VSASTVKSVVVTRAESADGPLSRELRSLGLQVILWPAVGVAAGDTAALDAALARLGDFDWLVFASRQAVAAVLERVPRLPAHLNVAAVGQATAQVLRQRGSRVDLVPDEASAAALVAAFAAQLAAGARPPRMLFPASSRALPTIATGLRQLGAQVEQVTAYETQAGRLDVDDCRALIGRAQISAVTFASPSAVHELADALGREDFARLLSGARAVAIGRTTARELAALGHESVVAPTATLHELALTTARVVNPAGTS
jgi:uroporphyrinogen III methyltransferase/synthase